MKSERFRMITLDVFHAAAKSDQRRNPIIHVGAHHGEEKLEYNQLGYETILWVEAQKTAFEVLERNVGTEFCFQGGVWNISNLEIDLHVTNNSVSTSFYELDPNNHTFSALHEVATSKVKTVTLQDVVNIFRERGFLRDRFVLRLDVQGSEYTILKSSAPLFKYIDFICCEVTGKRQIYKGAESRVRIVLFLLSKFWIPAFSRINPETSHGETIFIPIKRSFSFAKPMFYMRSISLIDQIRFQVGTRFLKRNRRES